MSTQRSHQTIPLVACLALLCATACDQGGGKASVMTPGDGQQWVGTPTQLHVGFRSSSYGIRQPFPEPEWWLGVGSSYAAAFAEEGALPAGVWIVGVMSDESTCHLQFPAPAGPVANVEFDDEDAHEAHLTYFDENGLYVWLQVEPADADVLSLIDLVLGQYSHHPSVVGFGVDVEWHRVSQQQWGVPVTDALAAQWLARIRSYNSEYSMFLKHWELDRMPRSARDGLFFVNDSQGVASAQALISEFRQWGAYFDPAPVGFQIGYGDDRVWWSSYQNPPAELGREIIDAVGNTGGLFWVDFTLREVFGG